MLTKTTTSIIAAIVVAVIAGVGLSVWSHSLSPMIPLAASFGGLIVFLGLTIEKEADKEKEKAYLGSPWEHARRTKLKSEIGWWILMVGIFIEIVVAFGLSVREANDLAEINRHNPINMPISQLTGTVVLYVDGNLVLPQPGVQEGTWLELVESNITARSLYFGEFQQLKNLSVDEVFTHRGALGSPSYTGYIMRFTTDRLTWTPGTAKFSPVTTPKQMLERIKALRVHVDFLPPDSKIVGDSAEIIINGNIRKEFTIYAQTNDAFYSRLQPSLGGIFFYATNSEK